ncbi:MULTISPECIES: ABC transporter permease subunit [unclassified Burkholderia]|uniref:ABC transporter permease subunit n=1 Tax=unclassified Burkholderia TaxID=2613784 RepID=UPI000754C59A|nr:MULTISPECIES: ABC transporter permease subunit [unclassified Burkholderia]KUY99984.1 taurine ABC transporter permease [Burkholderia sp. RF7-non_BP1]KUZ06138.1 taurine ABC transporter permease [Burkholderia sp. RF7-non_BP4]
MHEFARQGASVGRGRISTLHRQDDMSTQDSWAADRAAGRVEQDERTTRRKAARPSRRYRLPGQGKTAGLSAATVAALAVLWWSATHWQWLPPLFLPAPEAVWAAFVDAWHGRIQGGLPLPEHLLWSAARVFGAFLLATAIGVPAGVLMGVSRVARGVLDPLLEFYRPLPPLAYLPLVVIWFGIDETAKLVVIFLACFAPIAMAARAGVRAATVEQINAAYSLGGSFAQIVRHVVLPAALPEILTGLRIAIGFGWTTLVAAEMVAATAGLGQMVLNASSFLRTDIVVMGILIIGAIAWLFDLAMRWVERRIVPWKGRG